MYLCQFCQKSGHIGSEESTDNVFSSYMTLVTVKLGQSHKNLIIPFGCPKKVGLYFVPVTSLFSKPHSFSTEFYPSKQTATSTEG